MSFNYLGSPTVEDIQQLKEYLDGKYDSIDLQIAATQREVDRLRKVLVKLRKSEGSLGAAFTKDGNQYSLTDYIKSPVIDEDHSYFNQQKFDSSQTGNLVDQLTKPWLDHIKRETETLDYKIRKTTYLIEMRNRQIQLLQTIKDQLTDEDTTP